MNWRVCRSILTPAAEHAYNLYATHKLRRTGAVKHGLTSQPDGEKEDVRQGLGSNCDISRNSEVRSWKGLGMLV